MVMPSAGLANRAFTRVWTISDDVEVKDWEQCGDSDAVLALLIEKLEEGAEAE